MLLQAKLDIVSELRWCMVNGELRSREWKSLNEPKEDQLAARAGYQDQHRARVKVDKFCKEFGKYTIEELEERMGHMCKKVYSEVVADAGGERPLYIRVDLLLDKQGRVWLGERESWGADLNGNDEYSRMDPTYKELTIRMLAKAKENLRSRRLHKLRPNKLSPKTASRKRTIASRSSPNKRKSTEQKSTSPSKRASTA